MTPDKLNEILLDEIKKKLPAKANLTHILMESLHIGKEAVYRRLRREVPFTLYEVYILAKKLQLSLDRIMGLCPHNLVFEWIPNQYFDMREIDFHMLQEYLDVVKAAVTDGNSEFAYSCNTFPQYPSLKSEELYKFFSFKWMYWNRNTEAVIHYDKVEIHPHSLELTKKLIREKMNIENTYYIWDNTVFKSVVNEIGYFSEINLISKENVEKLKKELLSLLDDLEQIAVEGKFKTGKKVQIYITNINFDTTYCYLTSKNCNVSLIGAFTHNYLAACDKQSLAKIRGQINAIKKSSTLISESGEIQRISFFNKQREIINSL